MNKWTFDYYLWEAYVLHATEHYERPIKKSKEEHEQIPCKKLRMPHLLAHDANWFDSHEIAI